MIKNSKTIETIVDLRFQRSFSFFEIFETKREQDQRGLFSFCARITRSNVFENGVGTRWNDGWKKKKKGRKNLLKHLFSPSYLSAHDSRRGSTSIQLATDLSRPFSSSRWKVGERVVPWMRGEPRFENVAQGMGPAWMRNQLEKNGSKREEGVEWRARRSEVR